MYTFRGKSETFPAIATQTAINSINFFIAPFNTRRVIMQALRCS